VRLIDLGRAAYGDVHRLQQTLHAAVAAGQEPDTWIVVEHEPVITLGREAKTANIRRAPEMLAARGIDVVRIERGGDVTYHGPGQVVVYPIMRLERFREVVPLVNRLEAAVVAALATFGIAAGGRREHRGVYVGDTAICAIGLAVKQMTTMHGIALNVDPALDYDRLIVPCGTPEFGITSIAAQLGVPVPWIAGRDALLRALEEQFALRFRIEHHPAASDGPPAPADRPRGAGMEDGRNGSDTPGVLENVRLAAVSEIDG
jgi:lipoate-protein ligase B